MKFFHPLMHNTFTKADIDSVIKKNLFKSSLKKIDFIIDEIKKSKDPLLLSFLNQFYSYQKKKINKLASYHQKNFKDVIILGTGGSSKSGRTFVQIAYRTFGRHPKFPKITFLENIDFQDFNDLFKKVNLKKTGIIVISNSGETNETLVQFLIFLSKYRISFQKKKLQKHFTVIKKKGSISLRNLAKDFSINVIDLDNNLSGRFSAFSPVGLLPAAISGLNIKKITEGALSLLNKSSRLTGFRGKRLRLSSIIFPSDWKTFIRVCRVKCSFFIKSFNTAFSVVSTGIR